MRYSMDCIEIGNKKCYVFDEHHQVLMAWNDYFCGTKIAPVVITLDHHTDVLQAFNFQTLNNPDFQIPSNLSINKAIELLHHDEHIDYALQTGIINQSIIIAHTNSNVPRNSKITLLTDNFLTDDIPLNSPILYDYFSAALEDDFLSKFIKTPPNSPYILDIDLDYFKTYNSLTPKNYSIFRRLLKNAQLITISREEIWLNLLSFEKPPINSDFVITQLQKLLEIL